MIEEKKTNLMQAFEEFLNVAFTPPLKDSDDKQSQHFPTDRILTFKEVCDCFHLSPTTLERRIREGLKYSQAVRKGNRLFKLSDCNEFFNIQNT